MSETIERPIPWPKFVADNRDVFPSKTSPAHIHRSREENGLAECHALVKRGGRWYVFPSRFWRWFDGDEQAA